ncbi:DASH complex subunit ASK1 [Aspergillus melleus]|uniref:DASH complex subunit ASK1 n=1 Tax=Aspergillus melleus TaxID=138277 RepID=UPI001E8CE66A|nr:DASH complex subunit ask1 [Aspergillus melleus]KAH8426171.1 DASH complex subunit ask1 [Aspergillus melleus]
MSRPSSIAQRPLTLTEELEKLEQSITLTLQEIDHNFSQAHRIVTTSILPLVEQYADHSKDVWEGAKFWKQFFEASANVSLSGYEEKPEESTMQEQTMTEEEVTQSDLNESASYETPSSERHRPDDLELTELNASSHSTPRAQLDRHAHTDNDTTVTSSIAHPSPYHEPEPQFEGEDSMLPSTPGRTPSRPQDHTYQSSQAFDDPMSSSPFIERGAYMPDDPMSHQKDSDPVMHRLQDRTYRVQATPLGKGYGGGASSRPKFTVTPKPSTSKSKYGYDDSPLSSPEMEAPQLHAEIFSSPLKARTPGTGRKRRTSSNHMRVTPQPGLSVLTPAKGGGKYRTGFDSDDDMVDDDDEDFGPSPPKTMQFHIPQSRLMKTPAKEASKRIVEDLLFTAGANDTTDDVPDEQSPSVIRRVERLEDETF